MVFMISTGRICSIPMIRWSKEFLKEVRNAASDDEQYQSGVSSLTKDPENPDYIQPSGDLTVEDGLLYYKLRLYVPRGLVPRI